MYYFLNTCKLIEKCNLDEFDQLSVLISCMIHDLDHPGYNNIFLINNKNKLATRYNDWSVLENHSTALSFELMQTSDELDIMGNFEPKNWRRFWEMIISTCLSTDMMKHFVELENFKKWLTSVDFEPSGKDKMACVN